MKSIDKISFWTSRDSRLKTAKQMWIPSTLLHQMANDEWAIAANVVLFVRPSEKACPSMVVQLIFYELHGLRSSAPPYEPYLN